MESLYFDPSLPMGINRQLRAVFQLTLHQQIADMGFNRFNADMRSSPISLLLLPSAMSALPSRAR